MSETQSLEDLQPQRLEAFTRLLRPAQGLLISIGVIGGLVVLWEAGVRLLHVPEFILPAPSSIWQDTSALGLGILPHVGATLLTILGGYLIALIISLPLAVALFGSRLLSHAIYPLLIIKQSVPVVALAPILIVVLGAGEAPRIAITVIIALFPMVVSTTTGLKSTPVELTELSSAMGASFWKQLCDIRLPNAVPYIFAGAKISMTLAVVGAVVGEFVAAERGLGYLIYTSTAYFHVSIAFGAMIVLSIIGLALFQSIVWIERLPPSDARDIPVIDLAPASSSDASARKAVAWEIHKACRDTGFFYVANHGVPVDLMTGQLAWAQRFFALPLEEKIKLDMSRNKGPSGYEPMKLQTLDLGSPPDLKEGFQFHREVDSQTSADRGYRGANLWPEDLPGFRRQMDAYHAAVMQLGKKLMSLLALSLDLPEDYFAPGLDDLMCSVRLLHYPPPPADSAYNQLGAGAHTDWGSITMLLQDDCGGLEVQHASGEWIRATPIPGTFIINLGDMVRRWTNDVYHSTMHRVLNNVSNRDRYSVAAFFNPNYNYRVTCLPTCLAEGATPLYPPCTVGEHIKEMFERTYGRKAASAG